MIQPQSDGCQTGTIRNTGGSSVTLLKSMHALPDANHQSVNLPNHWNSLKRAGDQMIPNIMLSPLRPPEDCQRFESLAKNHGGPGRNRLIIHYMRPGCWRYGFSESVPFFIITLALSLVLSTSRLKATGHLTACLTDRSADQECDEDYLEQQYGIGMTTC